MTDARAARGSIAERRVAEFASAFESEDSFRALYDAALPRVYGYLHDRCGGERAVAEELTQQTFAAVVRQRATYNGEADQMTWITAIARRKLADHFRGLDRDERRRLRLTVREIAAERTTTAWRGAEIREGVVAALKKLPALQRAVLVLHYADGLSVREIAAEIGKSESAVESLMTRARAGFRSHYEEPRHD